MEKLLGRCWAISGRSRFYLCVYFWLQRRVKASFVPHPSRTAQLFLHLRNPAAAAVNVPRSHVSTWEPFFFPFFRVQEKIGVTRTWLADLNLFVCFYITSSDWLQAFAQQFICSEFPSLLSQSSKTRNKHPLFPLHFRCWKTKGSGSLCPSRREWDVSDKKRNNSLTPRHSPPWKSRASAGAVNQLSRWS